MALDAYFGSTIHSVEPKNLEGIPMYTVRGLFGRGGMVLLCAFLLNGCGATRIPLAHSGRARRASYVLAEPRGRSDVLVILALSGGGSRAAYFSAGVMLQLEKVFSINILKEVDVISSVSGGSLAAAYYAVSRDADGSVSTEMPLPVASLPADSFDESAGAATRISYNDGQLTVQGPLRESQFAALQAAFPGLDDRLHQLRERCEQVQTRDRVWEATKVRQLMSRDYLSKWFGHWFFPHNIARYWFTSFTRTNIMADVFADDLFDSGWRGKDLLYADLMLERPYLIVNATNATDPPVASLPTVAPVSDKAMDIPESPMPTPMSCPWKPPEAAYKPFTFTTDDFVGALGRHDLGEFRVSDAVMSSAAFPAVFNYVSLERAGHPRSYTHVFDGGNYDNLGLTSAHTIITCNDQPKKVIVLLVDSFIQPTGVRPNDSDPRGFFDFFVDTNFMDSFDSLLSANRSNMLNWFADQHDVHRNVPSNKVWFCHLSFEGVEEPKLRHKLNKIPTSFLLEEDHAEDIDEAVVSLVQPHDPCLEGVAAILGGETPKQETSNRVGRDPNPTSSPTPAPTATPTPRRRRS